MAIRVSSLKRDSGEFLAKPTRKWVKFQLAYEWRLGGSGAWATAAEVDEAGVRAAARSIALRRALPPVNLEAVCFISAMEMADEGDRKEADKCTTRV